MAEMKKKKKKKKRQTLVKAFKTKAFIGRVFTSGLSGRSVTDNRKSRENSCFSSSLIQIQVKSASFKQSGPFGTRLVPTGALHN